MNAIELLDMYSKLPKMSENTISEEDRMKIASYLDAIELEFNSPLQISEPFNAGSTL